MAISAIASAGSHAASHQAQSVSQHKHAGGHRAQSMSDIDSMSSSVGPAPGASGKMGNKLNVTA
jgi:hypothetical protein